MTTPAQQTFSGFKKFNLKDYYSTPTVSFLAILLLIGLGDAIISYVVPILLTQQLNDAFKMGLLMSVSSLVGLWFDFYASEHLHLKGYNFFIKFTLLAAVLFPIISLTSRLQSPLVLLGLMAIWGLYYETKGFASYNFTYTFASPKDYSKAWGLISSTNSLAYFVGPLIVVAASGYKPQTFLTISLVVFCVACAIYAATSSKLPKTVSSKPTVSAPLSQHLTTRAATLKIWLVLASKVWMLLSLLLTLVIIDSAFWTTGILFAEALGTQSYLGGFFITIYMLPGLVVPIFLPKVVKLFPGKKRLAFSSGLVAALFLLGLGLLHNVFAVLALVFCYSAIISLTYPALDAVWEDYVARLTYFGNDLVGLQQAVASLAYIIGPVLAGGLASNFGFQAPFALGALALAGISILGLVVTPKKIAMPIKELKQI